MPTYTRGIKRDQLRMVKVTDYLVYGFKTKDFASLPGVASEYDENLLGISRTPPNNLPMVLAANSPKPPRVSKQINDNPTAATQARIATFCDPLKLKDAVQAGWSIASYGVSLTFTTNDRTITAGAQTLDGSLLYVFPMNVADFSTYGGELGLQSPAAMSAAERDTAFSGGSSPRPPKVKQVITTGGRKSNFTCFCSADRLNDILKGNWSLLEAARQSIF